MEEPEFVYKEEVYVIIPRMALKFNERKMGWSDDADMTVDQLKYELKLFFLIFIPILVLEFHNAITPSIPCISII